LRAKDTGLNTGHRYGLALLFITVKSTVLADKLRKASVCNVIMITVWPKLFSFLLNLHFADTRLCVAGYIVSSVIVIL